LLNYKKIFSLSSGILGGRVFGYLRELCLVFFFGANSSSDIILIIFLMPDLVNNLVASRSISSVFLTEIRISADIDSVANKIKVYLNEIALISYVVLVFFSFLCYDFFVATYVSIALISIFYNFKFGVEISKSQYYNDFKYTSLANIIYNTGTILAVLLAIINIYFSCIIIVIFSFLRFYLARERVNNLYTHEDKTDKELDLKIISRKNFIIALTSTSIISLAPMFDKLIAFDIGDGVLSLYNYAEKIYILPLSLVLVPVFSANYPILSRLWNSKNKIEYNNVVKKVIAAALSIASIIFLFFMIFGDYTINFLFDFTNIGKLNILLIIKYFNILILGLIPNVIIIWFINVFLIRRLYKQLFFISIFMFLIKITYLFIITRQTINFESILIYNLIWLSVSALSLLFYYMLNVCKKQFI
jgi:putative peptidoglycan lipid II flippase